VLIRTVRRHQPGAGIVVRSTSICRASSARFSAPRPSTLSLPSEPAGLATFGPISIAIRTEC